MIQPETESSPLVSICIPVLDGGELVVRAVQSALDQEYGRIEVVVVDDASTDGTPETLGKQFGDTIRLFRNADRAGQAATSNLTVTHAQGPIVKFLHHDDVLDPDCVGTMAEPLLEWPSVGLVFARRRLEFPPGSDEGARSSQPFAAPHKGFAELKPLNPCPTLFEELVADGFRNNRIGEPSNVMVRKSCFDAVGGFDGRTRQWTDFDLWLRLLALYDAAFIDRELSLYRRTAGSVTARNQATGDSWLDRLWIIENLMSFPVVRDRYPELARMRAKERHIAWRTAVRGMLRLAERSAPPNPWIEYMVFRARRRVAGDRGTGQ
jgi:glycosyltransferase involved in cell wall biosynthesis